MEMLNSIKCYQYYKKLRKEELALKKLLKKKIDEVQSELLSLTRRMPKIKLQTLHTQPTRLAPKSIQRRRKLDQEIEDIKRRLEALQD